MNDSKIQVILESVRSTRTFTLVGGISSDIFNAYRAHYRHYHNLDHLDSCLDEFEEVRSNLCMPNLVAFSILYHDYIYIPDYSSNKFASSKMAVMVAKELGLNGLDCSVIDLMINYTKHSTGIYEELRHDQVGEEKCMSDTRFLCDIDLTIFGKSREEFIEYEKGIREEYWFVSDPFFKSGRIKILEQFLLRGHIYHTKYFRDKYEEKARENLKYSIQELIK